MAGVQSSVVEGLPFGEDKKKYIIQTLDPVLEEMVSDLLTEMPASPIDFMISWMRRRCGKGSSGMLSATALNARLKQELKQISGSLEEAGTMIGRGGDIPKDDEEEEEEDDDCGDDIPESMKMNTSGPPKSRASVSAEAYGTWNQKKAFVCPVYEKSDDAKVRLRAVLLKSFMFSELDSGDMDTIILAMKECNFKAGDKVFSEGEDGDCLFIIEKGDLDCLKKIDGVEKVVKSCATGDVFGELALLYNAPRAAGVVAKGDCVTWQLDRDTFNQIVKDAAAKRRNKYDEFLKSVTLISGIGDYERSQIADALKPEVYKKGDVVVKQDDPGDKFFILDEGSLYAMKAIPGEGEKRVMDYKSRGDYFGELALLKNQPRAANVIVESDVAKVLTMSRSAFSKMLGPLQNILLKQVATYE